MSLLLANRAVQEIIGGSPYPSILEDGNTVKWFDYLENVTKDGSDFVSVWDNKTGIPGIIPGALLQATPDRQPLWVLNNGILLDGLKSFMKTAAFTFNQPEQIYIVFNQIAWNTKSYIFDGNAGDSGILLRDTAYTPPTNAMKVYAGTLSPTKSDVVLNTPIIARVLYNGVNSTFQFNELGESVGNWGASNMGGFSLGGRAIYNVTTLSNMYAMEIILRKIADTAPNEQDIYDYLANRYSI